MSRRKPIRTEQVRRALAVEAARIMSEQGISDFYTAKRKAAERLHVGEDSAALPRNVEIEAALAEHQRLFGRDTHGLSLRSQRRAALAAMQMLREFEPRLVGPVLTGTATEHADVQLHLFADRAESVALHLLHGGIPHEVTERRVRMGPSRVLACPGVRFAVDEQEIDATVFPTDGIRQSPVSPVDGRPMRRASTQEVQGLVGEGLIGQD